MIKINEILSNETILQLFVIGMAIGVIMAYSVLTN